MRRTFNIVAVFLALLVLTGCGPDKDKSPEEQFSQCLPLGC